ncbi:MAG TPA: hypothetical protein VFX85_04245, partial [Solirubrobacterales bacterium]|nr:hypothetical protein [Solirubrobacterales bacterium]
MRSKRALFTLVAVLVTALVATTASFATARGPLYGFLAKVNKPAHAGTGSKARKGSVSKASRVTRNRSSKRGRGNLIPLPLPLPLPLPSPAPTPEPAPTPPADTTAPETAIAAGPSGSTTATGASFSFGASESGSTFECKLDAGSWAACTSPKSYSGLSVGSHTFAVRATDAAKNTDASPASRTWTVEAIPPPPPSDTTAPETTISSGTSGTTTSTSASFSFGASESGASFECRLDGSSWSPCASPKSYSGLAVGNHQFSVRASDAADNTDASPASRSWTVEAPAPPPPPADTTAPETSIASGPSGSTTATDASFGFSANESGSSFACRLDSGSWGSCASPKSYASLGVGSHTFSVRATDAAGNTDSSPAARSWTVEAAAPPPPPPPSGECNSTVSSVSAAQSGVSSAAAGSVVCLAAGSYGKVTLSASKAAPGVTLRAASPGQTTIAGASLSGSNLTLARFISTSSISVQPGASGMTIERNRV